MRWDQTRKSLKPFQSGHIAIVVKIDKVIATIIRGGSKDLQKKRISLGCLERFFIFAEVQ